MKQEEEDTTRRTQQERLGLEDTSTGLSHVRGQDPLSSGLSEERLRGTGAEEELGEREDRRLQLETRLMQDPGRSGFNIVVLESFVFVVVCGSGSVSQRVWNFWSDPSLLFGSGFRSEMGISFLRAL
jgi:hypothetical protein